MRILIIILLFVFLCPYAKADSVYVNNVHCAKADTPIVFEGGTNIIEVYVPTVKGSEIALKSLDRNLRIADIKLKGDTVTAMAMPYTTSRRMRLAIIDKRTGKIYKEIDFHGEKIPEPVATIGMLKDTADKVDKKDLLDQLALRFEFPNSLYKYPYRIESYTFKTQYGNNSYSIPVSGIFITTEVKKVIKELPPNTTVEFTDIVASCPSCNKRELKDIKVLVR